MEQTKKEIAKREARDILLKGQKGKGH